MLGADALDQTHLGQRIAYGPGLMFGGVLETVTPVNHDWHQGDELESYPSPSRMFIRTTDGRCATLSAYALVYIQGETDD